MPPVVLVHNLALIGPTANPHGVRFSTLPYCENHTLTISVSNVLLYHPLTISLKVPDNFRGHNFTQHKGKIIYLQGYT